MITFKIPRIASKPTKPKDEQSSATIPVSQNTPNPVASHVSKPVSPPMQQDTAVFPSSKDRTEHAAGTAASKKPTRPLQKKSIRDVAKISKALISKQLGKADTKKTVEDPVAPESDSPVPSRLASRAGSVGSSPFDGGAYDKEEQGTKGSKDKKMDAGTVGSTTRVAAPLQKQSGLPAANRMRSRKTAKRSSETKDGAASPFAFRQFVNGCISKYRKDQLPILASGVVYTTLVSLVPLVSLLVAFLTLFGVLEPFFVLLTDLFVSVLGEAAGPQFVSLLAQFSTNASSLGILGLVSFLITSVLLVNKVWSVANQIYRTARTRVGMFRRILGFATVLVVGAFLLGSYISVKSVLSSWFASIYGWNVLPPWAVETLRHGIPWLITWVCIFLLIMVAPNAKVYALSASLGALCGTLGIAGANWVFASLIAKVFTYSVIYGSFAAVFLFLLWIYFFWTVVFVAIEVSYVHQYRPDTTQLSGTISPAEQLANGINVMVVIGQHFRTGKGETKTKDIAAKLLMNDRQLHAVLEVLVSKQFIIPTNNSLTAYLPARPLENLMVVDLVEALFGEVYLDQNLDTIGDSIASQVNLKGIKTLGNLTMANILERI